MDIKRWSYMFITFGSLRVTIFCLNQLLQDIDATSRALQLLCEAHNKPNSD